MANNNVCAGLRGDDDAHGRCIQSRDRDGDRLPGHYQPDTLAPHTHGQHSHEYNDIYWAELPGWQGFPGNIDIGDDGPRNNFGAGRGRDDGTTDRDNDGLGWDRRTQNSAVDVAGEAETRPKNVAVNFYIKICNCRTPNCR